MGAFSKGPYNLHPKRGKSNFNLENKKAGDWRSNRRQADWLERKEAAVGTVLAQRAESATPDQRRGLYDSTGLRKSQVPTPSFDAIRRISRHRHRAITRNMINEPRRMSSSAGDTPEICFWSSGEDSGCAEITEARETAQIRATFSRGYEVARGRKARQIAPNPEIRPSSKIPQGRKNRPRKDRIRYSLSINGLWRAEGLPLIGRVSAAVRMSYRFAF
jgi:hypothetical protein